MQMRRWCETAGKLKSKRQAISRTHSSRRPKSKSSLLRVVVGKNLKQFSDTAQRLYLGAQVIGSAIMFGLTPDSGIASPPPLPFVLYLIIKQLLNR